MLRQSVLRSPRAIVRCTSQAQQTRSAHAISNPTLANIEKRWEGIPPQEQADLWMALRDRMKVNWGELTVQEKKAGLFSPPLPFSLPYQSLPPSLPHITPTERTEMRRKGGFEGRRNASLTDAW